MFKNGDRVEFTELGEGKKLLGGFEVGMTGTVVSTETYTTDYPVVKLDKPVVCGETVIEQTDCHVSRLRKI